MFQPEVRFATRRPHTFPTLPSLTLPDASIRRKLPRFSIASTAKRRPHPLQQQTKFGNVSCGQPLKFQPQPLGRLRLRHHSVQADLPLWHQKMKLNQFPFRSASRSFDEHSPSAQVTHSGDIAKSSAFPVNPHIPRRRHSHHSPPRGNRTREPIRQVPPSLSRWALLSRWTTFRSALPAVQPNRKQAKFASPPPAMQSGIHSIPLPLNTRAFKPNNPLALRPPPQNSQPPPSRLAVLLCPLAHQPLPPPFREHTA